MKAVDFCENVIKGPGKNARCTGGRRMKIKREI